jgi:hypothetical protein
VSNVLVGAEAAYCGLSSADVHSLADRHPTLDVLVRLRSADANGRTVVKGWPSSVRASFFVVACGSIPGVHAMSHIPTIFGMDGLDLSMLRIAPDSTQKGRALPGRAFVESLD